MAKQIVNDLVKKGTLIKINPGPLIHKDNWDKAMGRLKGYFDSHPNMGCLLYTSCLIRK